MIDTIDQNSSQRIIGTLAPQSAGEISQMDFISTTIAKMQVETDGIDLLLEMVKKNKLNPWDIDVVALADQYFAKTVELRANNLHVTGRIILFACILLRLKSDILEGLDPFAQQEEIEEFDDNFDDMDIEEEIPEYNRPSLKDVIQRRTSVRLNRKRNVTLNDLIKHLKFYEKLDKKRAMKQALERAKRRVDSYSHFTADDLVDLTHEDKADENVDTVRNVLTKIFTTEEKIEIKELQSTGLNKVSIYLALLFLSSRERVDLLQEEMYSDLYIVQRAEEEQTSEELI